MSNSSSSSFVVAFPENVKTTEEVKKYLFGDLEHVEYYDYGTSTLEAAKCIADDMKGQRGGKKRIQDALRGGYQHGAPDFENFRIPDPSNPQKRKWDLEIDWKAYEKATKAFEKELYENFMKQVPEGYKVYTFHYSDNDGAFFCTMEHGDVFDAAAVHLRISHH